jgi:hypothetical protein
MALPSGRSVWTGFLHQALFVSTVDLIETALIKLFLLAPMEERLHLHRFVWLDKRVVHQEQEPIAGQAALNTLNRLYWKGLAVHQALL